MNYIITIRATNAWIKIILLSITYGEKRVLGLFSSTMKYISRVWKLKIHLNNCIELKFGSNSTWKQKKLFPINKGQTFRP